MNESSVTTNNRVKLESVPKYFLSRIEWVLDTNVPPLVRFVEKTPCKYFLVVGCSNNNLWLSCWLQRPLTPIPMWALVLLALGLIAYYVAGVRGHEGVKLLLRLSPVSPRHPLVDQPTLFTLTFVAYIALRILSQYHRLQIFIFFFHHFLRHIVSPISTHL